jgi:DmsE family decaheme c-type cytochrome
MIERRRILPLLAVAGALLLAAGLSRGAPQETQQEMPADEPGTATDFEVEICAACHDEVVSAFDGPHAGLGGEGSHHDLALSCAGCHGDPTAHVEAGGGTDTIVSFDEANGHLVNAKVCLECHGDTHPQFVRSPHAQAGMACQSCHSIHQPAAGSWAMLRSSETVERPMENLSPASRKCQECHGEVFDQFEFNERHRLQEGVLDCTSCHDPHAPATRTRLAGFKQEQCVECHADKGGPFVFEHGSVRIEGCVACHSPHGSPNRHMLKLHEVGALCYSCHSAVPGFHSRFTLETNCTNCHSSIHGSNFDRFFLK